MNQKRGSKITPLGSVKMMSLKPVEKAALNSFLQQKGEATFNADKISTYYRVEKEDQTFFSALYTRVQRRNSYTVSYGNGKFGCIQVFLKHLNSVFALISQLDVIASNLSVPHDTTSEIKEMLEQHIEAIGNTFTMAMQCKHRGTFEVVDMCEVHRKCVFVEIGTEDSFLSTIPNFIE